MAANDFKGQGMGPWKYTGGLFLFNSCFHKVPVYKLKVLSGLSFY